MKWLKPTLYELWMKKMHSHAHVYLFTSIVNFSISLFSICGLFFIILFSFFCFAIICDMCECDCMLLSVCSATWDRMISKSFLLNSLDLKTIWYAIITYVCVCVCLLTFFSTCSFFNLFLHCNLIFQLHLNKLYMRSRRWHSITRIPTINPTMNINNNHNSINAITICNTYLHKNYYKH